MTFAPIAGFVVDCVVTLCLNIDHGVDPVAIEGLIATLRRRAAALDGRSRAEVIDALRTVGAGSDAQAAAIARDLLLMLRRDLPGSAIGGGGPDAAARHAARLIADIIIFAETCDEDAVDPDIMLTMIEGLGGEIDTLDTADRRRLVAAFAIVADDYDGEAREIVRTIPADLFLEEMADGDEQQD